MASRVAVVILRLYAAGIFLVTAQWKLFQEGYSVGEKIARFRTDEYVPMIEYAVAHPPVVLGIQLDVFAAFLRDVMLPGAAVFAPGILVFEALLGLGLLAGFGVRLLGGLGFVMMLAFTLAKPDPRAVAGDPVGIYLFSVRSSNWALTLIVLAVTLVAAGRVLGLDVWVRRRWPAWIRWIG